MRLLLVIITWACCFPPAAPGSVSPAPLFTSNMVLQRGMQVPVWGWADPGSTIEVTFNGQTVSCTAGSDGRWVAGLAPMAMSRDPLTMRITGPGQTRTFENVLIGDVWISSGQSNMESFPSWGMDPPDIAGDQLFRLFFIRHRSDTVVYRPTGLKTWPATSLDLDQESCLAQVWQTPTDENLRQFSVVTSHFGNFLRADVDVPLGLVHASWRGSKIEEWMEGGRLHNGTISPIAGYAFTGVIWWQGEFNNNLNHDQYAALFNEMVPQWRRLWGIGDFAFCQVQLQSGQSFETREGQFLGLSTPRTGMVVTMDACKGIHPAYCKQEVARRLALWARAMVYGRDLVYSGPLFTSVTQRSKDLVVSFEHTGSGLELRTFSPSYAVDDGGKPWRIAGADGNWAAATARIEGNTIVLSSPSVTAPLYASYAQSNTPSVVLYNKEGLPASGFNSMHFDGERPTAVQADAIRSIREGTIGPSGQSRGLAVGRGTIAMYTLRGRRLARHGAAERCRFGLLNGHTRNAAPGIVVLGDDTGRNAALAFPQQH